MISGNRATPAETLLPQSPEEEADWPHCPDGFCASRAGSAPASRTSGNLTLIRTTVTRQHGRRPGRQRRGRRRDLELPGHADDRGLGARAATASAVGDPNGRFAEGGAMLVENGSGPVVIRDTLIGDNQAELSSHLPPFADDGLIDVQAHAAGMLVANDIPTTIERSVFAGNDVAATNPVGEPLAFDSALQVLDSPLTMRDTLIAGNTVTSDTLDDRGRRAGGHARSSSTAAARSTRPHPSVTP